MAFNLRHRSFVKLLDYSPKELKFLLRLSADLKAAKYGGYEVPTLAKKNIALIFEKASTRTRTAFEVAAYDQGAHVTYLGPTGTQIGKKESMKEQADKWFKNRDKDGDGKLSFEEFEAGRIQKKKTD